MSDTANITDTIAGDFVERLAKLEQKLQGPPPAPPIDDRTRRRYRKRKSKSRPAWAEGDDSDIEARLRRLEQQQQQPPEPLALTIPEFCYRHGISEAMYFVLQGRGEAPRTMSVGRRRLISIEAAAEWRAERERIAAEAASTTP